MATGRYKSDRINVITIGFCSVKNKKLQKCDDRNIDVCFHFAQIFTSAIEVRTPESLKSIQILDQLV